MNLTAQRPTVQAPTTYSEWLSCFDRMKNEPAAGGEIFDIVCEGSFAGSDLTRNALQKQIVETVNAVLDRSVKRFLRNLNENIAFNELSQTELLFKRLKKDVQRSLFFTRLSFLPKEFRAELEGSVRDQMRRFWDDTIRFLYDQSLEFSNSELEDLLFLVKRIRLFQ